VTQKKCLKYFHLESLHTRVDPGADVKADRLHSGKVDEDELWDDPESDDPGVDKEVPEVVVKSCRIFEVKNEEKSGRSDGVTEQHSLVTKSIGNVSPSR